MVCEAEELDGGGYWLTFVLILVLMEDGLRERLCESRDFCFKSLNPCFNGRWSASILKLYANNFVEVLILVLMEDGLRDWHIRIILDYF